jgi:predicted RNase H-like nuclease (RuvC/YqgF family)
MPSSNEIELNRFPFTPHQRDRGLIPSELDKEKLRRAEDLISKKEDEIASLRSSVSTLKTKVENLTDQVKNKKMNLKGKKTKVENLTDLNQVCNGIECVLQPMASLVCKGFSAVAKSLSL